MAAAAAVAFHAAPAVASVGREREISLAHKIVVCLGKRENVINTHVYLSESNGGASCCHNHVGYVGVNRADPIYFSGESREAHTKNEVMSEQSGTGRGTCEHHMGGQTECVIR